jgi:hypothetical protein
MVKARYSARAVPGAILIYDEYRDDAPTMTVTNDAEAVVAEAVAMHGNYPIAYLNTDGRWDQLHHDNGKFQGFRPCGPDMNAIIQRWG